MRRIGAGAQNRSEMQAGGAVRCALEGLVQVAAVLARFDRDARAVVEAEGGDVEALPKACSDRFSPWFPTVDRH